MKGEDLCVYDVGDALQVSDYFVVVTGTSRPHVKALYEEIHHRLKNAGEKHARAEGADMGWWVLLDFGPFVVHVFHEDTRAYYDIERLWSDVPKTQYEDAPPADRATG